MSNESFGAKKKNIIPAIMAAGLGVLGIHKATEQTVRPWELTAGQEAMFETLDKQKEMKELPSPFDALAERYSKFEEAVKQKTLSFEQENEERLYIINEAKTIAQELLEKARSAEALALAEAQISHISSQIEGVFGAETRESLEKLTERAREDLSVAQNASKKQQDA